MNLYTRPEVLCTGREFLKQHSVLNATELIDANNRISSFDLYLICSPADDEFILGCSEILKKHGLRVYIERCNDAQFTAEGCSVAALDSMLRRMNKARLLLYATTEELLMPRWLVWMLGVFEGRQPGNCAVWSISVSHGNEKLDEPLYALYPLICHREEKSVTTSEKSETLRRMSLNDFALKNSCWGFAS